jgi:hypothetical protein
MKSMMKLPSGYNLKTVAYQFQTASTSLTDLREVPLADIVLPTSIDVI